MLLPLKIFEHPGCGYGSKQDPPLKKFLLFGKFGINLPQNLLQNMQNIGVLPKVSQNSLKHPTLLVKGTIFDQTRWLFPTTVAGFAPPIWEALPSAQALQPIPTSHRWQCRTRRENLGRVKTSRNHLKQPWKYQTRHDIVKTMETNRMFISLMFLKVFPGSLTLQKS